MKKTNNALRYSTEWVTRDKEATTHINEFPEDGVSGAFVSVSVFPEDTRSARQVTLGGPYHELYGVAVGHATLFLTKAEFDDLRNKVIESMVKDGTLTDLSAEAEHAIEAENAAMNCDGAVKA